MNMNLQNLQGWLRVYFVYLLIDLALTAVWVARSLVDGYGLQSVFMNALSLGFLAFATWALTQTGRSWVRILHIAINGITIALLLANTMGLPVFPCLAGLRWRPCLA